MRLRWLLAATLLAACSSDPAEGTEVGLPDAEDAASADAGVEDSVTADTVDVSETDVDVGSSPLSVSFERISAEDYVWGSPVVSVRTEGRVSAVEFLLNGETIRIDDSPPYVAEFSTAGLGAGAHLLAAVVRGPSGEASTELTVQVDRQRPTVQILQPGLGIAGPVGGELLVEVVASDNDEIAYVEFSLNYETRVGRLYGPERMGVFPVDFEPGDYVLTAAAYDRTGLARFASVDVFVCEDSAVPCVGNCVLPEGFADLVSSCGGCGIQCANGESCSGGSCLCELPRTLCGSTCADLSRDTRHCGECEQTCAEACLGGECVTGIPSGFQLISPAEFVMGSDGGHWGAQVFEAPAHSVTISRPYLIAQTEVTQQHWFDLMRSTPSSHWDCGPNCPVESVTWWEAIAFTNAMSVAEGLEPCYVPGGCTDIAWGSGRTCRSVFINAAGQNPLGCEGYRLPTEAEWEFAARAGATGSSVIGEILSFECQDNMPLAEVAWFDCNSRGRTHEVAQLLPNEFGLYDMSGNVFEWTGDQWGDFTAEPQVDPIGADETLILRPMRGGAYNERSDRMRLSARLSANPEGMLPFLGFRVARSWSTP
ncbi:MAG: sulfatase activating formylglycine-generating enzyme [Bradymonadia bacterium]